MSASREQARKINAIAMRTTSVIALNRFLKPRLAMDAKVSLADIFDGVPVGPKFKDQKSVIATRVRALTKGKLLAQDTKLDDVEKVLDMLESHEVDSTEGVNESVSKAELEAMEAAARGESDLPNRVGEEFDDDDKAFDAEGFKGFLREKGMGEDDIMAAMGMMPQHPPALDEEEETDEEKRKREEREKSEKEKDANDMKDMVTKPAMDAAITAATAATEKRVRENERGIRLALDLVRPYIGELPPRLAFDSAHDVYRHTLVALQVEGAKDLHEAALLPVLQAQPKIGARPVERSVIAQDSAQQESYAKRYPHAGRVGAA